MIELLVAIVVTSVFIVSTISLYAFCLFSLCYVDHRHLHSFPTRRSSDLAAAATEAHLHAVEADFFRQRNRLDPTRQVQIPVRNADLEGGAARSEEHTSELQSLTNLVCRLLLEKKKE